MLQTLFDSQSSTGLLLLILLLLLAGLVVYVLYSITMSCGSINI